MFSKYNMTNQTATSKFMYKFTQGNHLSVLHDKILVFYTPKYATFPTITFFYPSV